MSKLKCKPEETKMKFAGGGISSLSLIFLVISLFTLLDSTLASLYKVGVGIADVTGPAAEVGMVKYICTDKSFTHTHTHTFSPSNHIAYTLRALCNRVKHDRLTRHVSSEKISHGQFRCELCALLR